MQDQNITKDLTIKEAAAALGVHPDTVRRMISKGEIEYEKRGKGKGQYFIPADAIDSIRTAQQVVVVKGATETDVTELHNAVKYLTQVVIELKAEVEALRALTNEREPPKIEAAQEPEPKKPGRLARWFRRKT
jgi:excisionase family DNA binding protein